MDKTKLIQRLMATFLDELQEHVRALNQDLLALEKDPSGEERAQRFKALFRTVHSLKGAARSVNVTLIESACHRLEELLTAARDGRAAFTPDLFALLFTTADGFEEAAMRLREQHDLSGGPLAALLPRLDAAVGLPKPAAATKPPAADPLPPQSPVTLSPCQPATLPSAADAPPASASVRVQAERLDTLLARTGELLVARRRVEARLNDLAAMQGFIDQWQAEWQPVHQWIESLRRRHEREPEPGRTTTNGTSGPWPRRAASALHQVRDHLRRLANDLERLAAGMTADVRFLGQTTGPLGDEVRRVRLLPFAEACQGLDRMVRDLAQSVGKEVELVIEGGTVEMDRSVLEGLKDPLRHLVRNAVDHGIEPPDRRRTAGKPAQARVTVSAALRGAQVDVVVGDDGQGLDLDALREQARRHQLPEPVDEAEVARLIFLPGLSTARLITDVSGRGVGMDVVKSKVEALHGSVDLVTTAGAGTCFTLTVPLTLTTLRAVLVAAAGQIYALAGTNVHKLVRTRSGDLRSIAGRQVLTLGGPPLALASLAEVLGHKTSGLATKPPGARGSHLDSASAAEPGAMLSRPVLGRASSEISPGRENMPSRFEEPLLSVVIVTAGDRRMAIVVDEFLAEQEIMVKNLGPRVRHLRHVSGATLLPSGRIALVLNAAHLVRTALGRPLAPAPMPAPGEAASAVRKRLLVADDSVTTRTLEKSILEAAGYEVATAPDGQAAWQLLQDQPFDLLVSDVEMPRMDGFALATAVRASPALRDLPVILVTARDSESDKARGIEVGADAYLVKSAFDQKNLLETVAQLL
jgi:two-component system chemotaxis sensor kinase CheA